jgi:hypothetical protein
MFSLLMVVIDGGCWMIIVGQLFSMLAETSHCFACFDCDKWERGRRRRVSYT